MTTTVAKCLAVAVCVMSLGFMGFTVAVYSGGKNWSTEINAPDIADKFQFTNSGGENPTWSVTKVYGGGGPVGGAFTSLPEAITAARKDLQTYQRTKIGELEPAIAEAEATPTATKELNATDITALESRIAELDTSAAALEKAFADASTALTKLMDASAKTRKEAARRREDVARLQNQLELIRTDTFRLTELKRTLTDRLVQLKVNNDSLRQRKQQLSNP